MLFDVDVLSDLECLAHFQLKYANLGTIAIVIGRNEWVPGGVGRDICAIQSRWPALSWVRLRGHLNDLTLRLSLECTNLALVDHFGRCWSVSRKKELPTQIKN